ncbi:MAG TPA: hypothetical protein VE404_04855 [Verrucomicrobiae bacterium]|nr:hypothetical protein [Verrucomicrobiae bacterium]
MIRKMTLGRTLLALALPIALAGVTFAGGEHCNHGKDATAAGKEMGEGCPIAKNVKSVAQMTDNGAVVTLTGKSDEAVEHIQTHLKAHQNGESCPDCPLSMAGVTTKVEITKDGGVLTVSATTPEALKAIQAWASKPMAGCCAKGHGEKA